MRRTSTRVAAALLAGALSVALGGCRRSGGNAASGEHADDWFPMQPGARWVYEVKTELGSLDLEVAAKGEVAVRGGDAAPLFVMEETNRGPSMGFAETSPVAYRRENGYLARFQAVDYDGEGKLRMLGQAAPTWFLPDEPKAGAKWHQENELFATPENPGGKMRWDGEVRAVAALEVPAGKFDEALQIHTEYRETDAGEKPTMEFDDYYVRGVGLIRSVTHDPSGDPAKSIEIRLKEYDFPQ